MSNLTLSELFSDGVYKNYYGIINDHMFKLIYESLPNDKKIVDPYCSTLVREKNGNKIISYGQSSFGYDIRVAPEFKIYSNINSAINDPKKITNDHFYDIYKDEVIIPPNSYVLCRSIERFDLPKDVTAIAVGKSTYARAGIIANLTPLEAGWCGFLTIELANCSPLPAKIYANEGICQILFFKGIPCDISYEDRKGKYQNQNASIHLPKL